MKEIVITNERPITKDFKVSGSDVLKTFKISTYDIYEECSYDITKFAYLGTITATRAEVIEFIKKLAEKVQGRRLKAKFSGYIQILGFKEEYD